eukprot:c18845_g2_i1.p1 GENE.c18845_g2_i1~~c18845_g2_i1.p1  ORF type:complete len:289 (+),score=112.42 c18845_g2_i1:29-868(+)
MSTKTKGRKASTKSDDAPSAKKRKVEPKVETKVELKKVDITVDYLLTNVADDWKEILKPEMEKKYFKDLLTFLNSEYASKVIHPDPENIFAAFSACPLKDVRVVILGQDPYPTPGNAHGLCFSVEVGVNVPPSLKNVYKELESDPNAKFVSPNPPHGHLGHWAKQGILLLNTVLTVQSKSANSHAKKGWETFTDFVIQTLDEKKKNIVYLLWGKPSELKASKVSKTNNCVLITSHPSPLSARAGFLGSLCFSKANEYLKKTNQVEIDWQLPPLSELKKE